MKISVPKRRTWVNRAFGCTGITLFRFSRLQVELWLCPARGFIPPHMHPNIKSYLVFLFGSMIFEKLGERIYLTTWKNFLRSFLIAPGELHAARVEGSFGAFLNIEVWEKGVYITSAANNIVISQANSL